MVIIKVNSSYMGAFYLLMEGESLITAHRCRGDEAAWYGLFQHPETKVLVGDMTFTDFKKIPIVDVKNLSFEDVQKLVGILK